MDTELLGDSHVSRACLEKFLQIYFNTKSELAKCQATVISKGMGVTSQVMRVHLEWSNEGDGSNLPKSVIVKCPMVACLEQALENFEDADKVKEAVTSDTFVKLIHKTECDAYKILNTVDPPPVPLPLIYGINEDNPDVIIMEDLGNRAGVIKSTAVGMTYDQWHSTTIHLAGLHAWSLTTDVPWSTMLPGPEVILHMMKAFSGNSLTSLKATIDKYGDYFGAIDYSLYQKNMRYESLVKYYEIYDRIMPKVMIHGDAWINNIMFYKDAKNPNQFTDRVAAFLDWQISSAGCGLNDLAKLTAWCVPSELRRKHTTEIVKLYYEEFSSKAARCITNSKFTLENVQKIFRHILAFNLLLIVPMTEYALIFTGKVHEDETGQRKDVLLKRYKDAYDDGAAYFNSEEAHFIFDM